MKYLIITILLLIILVESIILRFETQSLQSWRNGFNKQVSCYKNIKVDKEFLSDQTKLFFTKKTAFENHGTYEDVPISSKDSWNCLLSM